MRLSQETTSVSLSESEQRELAYMQYADLFADADKGSFDAGWDALLLRLGGPDHILKIWDDGVKYTVQHPITERLQHDLFHCRFGALAEALMEVEPLDPGFFRIWQDRGALLWEAIEDDSSG
jgi:hypothetical protein